MKFIVLKEKLVAGVGAVERSAGIAASLPVLKNALVVARDGIVAVTATNLELASRAVVSGKVIDPGSITVPLGILSAIVKNLNADRVTLEQRGTKLVVSTDNYEASIQGTDAKEFPIVPEIQSPVAAITLRTEVFIDALGAVIGAAQYSEIRPEISGVFVNLQDGTLTLVATDSFRLAEYHIREDAFTATVDGVSFIIPLRAAEETLRVLSAGDETMTLTVDQGQLVVNTETRRVTSRLIDGKFPEYQAIIPRGIQTSATVERVEFLNAVRLTSSFSSRANDVTVSVGENKKFLELSSADPALGENRYHVSTRLKGEKFSIVFNWRYLLDGIKMYRGQDVVLGVNPTGPVTITEPNEGNLRYVLMPIKS